MSRPTSEQLKSLFWYDSKTGNLIRKVSTNSNTKVGDTAGRITSAGYRQVSVYGKKYVAHHLIWVYHYNEWPKELDHINRVRDDNRIENLRLATRTQNLYNRLSYKGSKSRYKGVSLHKASGKWCAYHQTPEGSKWLGLFNTEKEAAEVYKKATKGLHKEFSNYNLERYEDEDR